MGLLPLKGEKIRIFHSLASKARVFDRMMAASSLHVSDALLGDVARVASMVLVLNTFEFTSQVVAPDCSRALQMRRA